MLKAVLSLLSDAAFALSPLAAYLPQYFTIRRTRSDGFSSMVCLILLSAHTFRVLYWLGARFKTALLFQSLVTLSVQFLLLYAIVSVKREKTKEKKINTLDMTQFWQWTAFEPYLTWYSLFFTTSLFIFALFRDSTPFVEAMGTVGCALEASLAIPQILKNFHSKTTQGISLTMVIGWLVGDTARMVFLFANNTPVAFILSGLFQIITDVVVLVQITILYPSTHVAHES